MIRTAPVQLQAAMAGTIQAARQNHGATIGTGQAYDTYKTFCNQAGLRTLTGRAFSDLLTELAMYSFLRARVFSRGRYGRTRELMLDLPDDVIAKIHETILINLDLRNSPVNQL